MTELIEKTEASLFGAPQASDHAGPARADRGTLQSARPAESLSAPLSARAALLVWVALSILGWLGLWQLALLIF